MLYGCIKMGQFDESEGARGMVAGANNQTKSNKTMLQTNIAVSRPRCWWDRGVVTRRRSRRLRRASELCQSQSRENNQTRKSNKHIMLQLGRIGTMLPRHLGRCCVPGVIVRVMLDCSWRWPQLLRSTASSA